MPLLSQTCQAGESFQLQEIGKNESTAFLLWFLDRVYRNFRRHRIARRPGGVDEVGGGRAASADSSKAPKKKVGLVWYSSTTAEDALALTKKFHEQHPVDTDPIIFVLRAKSCSSGFSPNRAPTLSRPIIVSLPELELSVMIKRKLLARYEGVEKDCYPAETKDPHGFWTGLYTSAWVPAYNTKLVSKDAAPKSYKDLLNPKWKGGIAMDNEPYNWYVVSLRYLEKRDGKEAATDYMRKLAAQQMQWRKGHSLIGQLMSAGEFPLAAELQVHTVERAKAQGAPVEWSVLDGVIPISKVAAAITSTGANIYTVGVVLRFSAVAARHGNDSREPADSDSPDVTAPYLKPYKLLPFEQQVMDDFDKYVENFRATFRPAQ